jgi:hypothetical protein
VASARCLPCFRGEILISLCILKKIFIMKTQNSESTKSILALFRVFVIFCLFTYRLV